MNSSIPKLLLMIMAALFMTGGACYQTKETPEHRANAAKYVLPICTVDEKTEQKKCRFAVSCRFSTGYLMMDYKLAPPAMFTFDNHPFDEKLAISTPCEHEKTAFVLTDINGNLRRDEYDFRKLSLAESKINADRQSDLIIQLKDVSYPRETELQLVLTDGTKEVQKLEFFRVPTDAPNKMNQPEYDSDNLTLKIPSANWKNISGAPNKMFLQVKTKVQKPTPGTSEWSTALTYDYQTETLPFRLR